MTMRVTRATNWRSLALSAAMLCTAGGQALQQRDAASAAGAADSHARLQALWALLLVSLILLVLFVCGALLIFRHGRRAVGERSGHEDTPYVDAWRQYRLSEDQVDAVGNRPEGDDEPGS